MKKTASLFLMALLSGAVTLGAYKIFFEKDNEQQVKYVSDKNETPFLSASTATTKTPINNAIGDIDFTVAAEKTVNAVVHVKNVTTGKSGGSGSILDFFYGFEGQSQPQVGTGSGVIITPDGYIVTNNHVIDGSRQLEVTLNNNKNYEAKIIGADPNTDIALLKIETDEALPYLAFGDSDNAKIGEWVLAVGNPFNLTSTVTAGIVSAKARSLASSRNQSFIQTDAAVNPGNSGGALVNTSGDLIGINTAITSQTGSYVGYSFAVPSNIAKKVVEDLLEYGNVQKGMLGISALNSDSREAIQRGLDEIEGVYVSYVEEESGAYDANIKEGDIIKKVDDIKVRKFSELSGYLSAKRPGDKINVTIERDGRTMIIPVRLKKSQIVDLPSIGFRVKNLTKSDKKAFKTDKGVKIVAVPQRYQGYGLQNKVIVAIDDESVTDIDDAKDVFSKISRYERTSITMIDENGEREKIIFQ